MLSYEHAYHAGNHADILKHAVLSLIIAHLKKKDAPFSLIDTHAGSGVYDLSDSRAEKTGEAGSGVRKYLAFLDNGGTDSFQDAAALLSPFHGILRRYAEHGLYAGSPEVARCLLREGDSLVLSELHPQAFPALKATMKKAPLRDDADGTHAVQPHLHKRNGFELLSALVPPKRGAVLTDPSFEERSDFTDCAEAFTGLLSRWKGGILALWYPLTAAKGSALRRMKQEIVSAVQSSATEKRVLDMQLLVRTPDALEGKAALYGSGMLVVNYPYQLDLQAETVLPLLKAALGEEGSGWSAETL